MTIGATAATAALQKHKQHEQEEVRVTKSQNEERDGGTGAAGVKRGSSEEEIPEPPATGFWKYQRQAETFYKSLLIQMTVAVLIGLNFFMNMLAKEIDPLNRHYTDTWKVLEIIFNVVFTFELMLNMYGTWCCRFWRSGWNKFDFLVVSIGLIDTFQIPLPPPLKMLRMMRAFRVFRLFAKIKSLNKIVVSLAHAVPGMMNAMMINLLVMSIYAVVAVEFYDGGGACELAEDERPAHGPASILSGRQYCYGTEYWGKFSNSMYTLFQVLTGESWSEAVVRPLIWSYDSQINAFGTAVFFISFIIVNAIVLLNVVVAVLLEKMASDPNEEAGPEVEAEENKKAVLAQDVAHLMEEMNNIQETVHKARTDMESLQVQVTKISELLEHAKVVKVSV